MREAKRGKDVKRYVQAVERLAALAPDDPEAEPDRSWVDTMTKEGEAAAERMEAELKRYKNNLIKESIRVRRRVSVCSRRGWSMLTRKDGVGLLGAV